MTGKRKVTSPSRPGRKCAKTAGTGDEPQAGSSTEVTANLPDEVAEDHRRLMKLVASLDEAGGKMSDKGANLTEQLSRKFERKKVEVDDFVKVPNEVWFVSEDCCTEAPRYILTKVINGEKVIPEEYRTKWRTKVNPATKCLLHLIKGLMEKHTRSLKFQHNLWGQSEDAGSGHAKEDNTDTASRSGNDPKLAEKSDKVGGGASRSCDDAKVAEKKSDKVGGGDYCPKEITEVEKDYRTYTLVACHKMVFKLKIALMNRMMNSKGRAFIDSLLNVASDVCFGFSNHIEVMPVGSSTYSPEGLAVRLRPVGRSGTQSRASSASVSPSPSHLPATPVTSPPQIPLSAFLPENFTPPTSRMVPVHQSVYTNQSQVTAKQPSRRRASSQGSFREADGYIYPDCVVACIDEANFAKYIFVCEIKSSHDDIKEKEFAQLVRQMLGACIEQNEVFGIIMNCSFARIARMIVDEERSQIQYGERFYPLVSMGSFNNELFYELLCDVIAVLDYGNKHIGRWQGKPQS